MLRHFGVLDRKTDRVVGQEKQITVRQREREQKGKDGEKPSRPAKIRKGYKTGRVYLSKVIKETRSSTTLLQFKYRGTIRAPE